MAPEMATLRHVDTARLRIAYLESGEPDGPPVLLMHGWPDDASTWGAVRGTLDAAGFRVISPYLRGFGPTLAHAGEAPCGQLSVMAQDLIALADALGIDRFALAGHDWGARITYLASALFPERIRAAVALSVGHGQAPGESGLSLNQAQNYWYQWYLATPMGEAALRKNRQAFCQHLWQQWAPGWSPAPGEFERVQASFDNPDWLAVSLHSYRHRWGLAEGLAEHAEYEARAQSAPPIRVPCLVLHGADDRCNAPSTSERREAHFLAAHERRLLPGVGHFPQRERPELVTQALLGWFSLHPD